MSAMSAPQRDGIRGAVHCLNLFLFPYLCMVLDEKSIRSKHVRIVSLHRTRPLVDTSSVSLRSVGTLLQCAHKGDAVGSSRINCVVRSSLLRFASVSCVCFFTRHCLLFEPTMYLGSARRWNANVQSHCMCQHWPCRFSSGTFFEGVCCVRFLRYCDLSVFASLLDVHRSRHQTLECNWNCVLGYTCKFVFIACVVGIVSDCRVLYRVLCWRPV